MSIYREFLLRTADDWRALTAFIKSNAKAFAEKGEPLRLIVTSDERKRTSEQNRFWHGPVLDAITEQAWWQGKQYPKIFWKEYFRQRYLLRDEFVTPEGEVVQVFWSTADSKFSVGMMKEFLDKVMVEAGTQWGVDFEGF